MESFTELWNNQPNTVVGVGLAVLVLFGIYIKLLDIYNIVSISYILNEVFQASFKTEIIYS